MAVLEHHYWLLQPGQRPREVREVGPRPPSWWDESIRFVDGKRVKVTDIVEDCKTGEKIPVRFNMDMLVNIA